MSKGSILKLFMVFLLWSISFSTKSAFVVDRLAAPQENHITVVDDTNQNSVKKPLLYRMADSLWNIEIGKDVGLFRLFFALLLSYIPYTFALGLHRFLLGNKKGGLAILMLTLLFILVGVPSLGVIFTNQSASVLWLLLWILGGIIPFVIGAVLWVKDTISIFIELLRRVFS